MFSSFRLPPNRKQQEHIIKFFQIVLNLLETDFGIININIMAKQWLDNKYHGFTSLFQILTENIHLLNIVILYGCYSIMTYLPQHIQLPLPVSVS